MEAENNQRAEEMLCRNTLHTETDTRAGICPGWLLGLGGCSPSPRTQGHQAVALWLQRVRRWVRSLGHCVRAAEKSTHGGFQLSSPLDRSSEVPPHTWRQGQKSCS